MLSAEDKVEIGELLASYSRCLDSGDVDGYVKLFAPDGVLDGSSGPRRGHTEIRQVAEAMATINKGEGAAHGQRHFAGQPVIEQDGNGCQVRSYFLLVRQSSEGEAFIRAMGEYADTCEKHEGQWVFARREIRLLLGRFGA